MATFPDKLDYKYLSRTNDGYDCEFWKECRALYAGGKKLLADKEIMARLFPKHAAEDDDVYRERLRRAYYSPYAGEIIDSIVASLLAEPLTMQADPEPPPYYAEFFEDLSKAGGRKQSLNQLLREQVLNSLITGSAWTLVDMPPPGEYKSEKEQAEAGALDAYACAIDPECVVDWETDDTGALLWALVKYETKKRSGITEDRNLVTETFMYYTREAWAKYEITYKEDEKPKDGTEVPKVGEGAHTFGEVPLIHMEIPDGLYAMGKIHSIAVAHFNKRNALSWAEYKTLFPVPVASLGASDPLNSISDDDARAHQKHGPGYMRVLAEKDRLEYFSPDAAPFAHASADLDKLRDEMHRVLHAMAMSVDNSGAALQRSADSKAIDAAMTAVVLRALGSYLREHAQEIYRLTGLGRKDGEIKWKPVGLEEYDDTTSGALIEQAMTLEAVRIPSKTFQVHYKFDIAKRLLGKSADEEELKKVKSELESNISNEDFAMPMDPNKVKLEMAGMGDKGGDKTDKGDEPKE